MGRLHLSQERPLEQNGGVMLRSCREEQGFGHFGVEDFEPGKRSQREEKGCPQPDSSFLAALCLMSPGFSRRDPTCHGPSKRQHWLLDVEGFCIASHLWGGSQRTRSLAKIPRNCCTVTSRTQISLGREV